MKDIAPSPSASQEKKSHRRVEVKMPSVVRSGISNIFDLPPLHFSPSHWLFVRCLCISKEGRRKNAPSSARACLCAQI